MKGLRNVRAPTHLPFTVFRRTKYHLPGVNVFSDQKV